MDAGKFQTWEEAVTWLINQPSNKDIARDCYYDQPAQLAANRYWQSDEWHSIKEFLPEVLGQALDIGAGNGIASYALAKDGWQVDALEPDPSNLVGIGAIRKLASDSRLPINAVQEFGEQLPFSDLHFDLVFARQVLHHAKDLPKFCQEVYRVLKPGGMFIAVRDHVIHTKSDLPKFLESHPLHNIYGGENAYLRSEYLGAIKSARFEIDHVLDAFDSPINYSPHTYNSLKQEVSSRIGQLPGITNVITSDVLFPLILKLMSKIDRRPGRAISFICRKQYPL